MSPLVQSVIVGVVVLAACIYVVVKMIRNFRKKKDGCSGCDVGDCALRDIKRKPRCH